ncbi:MAG TPA: hypothetical protein VFR02_10400, partial [bacterium]|nr:hypothetical protein [bacterium]
MRTIMMAVWGWACLAPLAACAQVQWVFQPLGLETRFDDNVFRLVSQAGRLSDEVDSLSGGLGLEARDGGFSAKGGYSLNADAYQFYSGLDNFTHDLTLDLSQESGDFLLRYTNDSFFRSSAYYEFDYFDEANLVALEYDPDPGWSLRGGVEALSRDYYADQDYVVSRNFTDDGASISAQRLWPDSWSAKLALRYGERRYNRYAVASSGSGSVTAVGDLQDDRTVSLDLGLHAYLLQVLQDLHLTCARTNSNSYGFSNWVGSLSWAGVLSPAKDFYLELFFRLYEKDYDFQPLDVPDLQLGFSNDDGQDLLAVKGSWEW